MAMKAGLAALKNRIRRLEDLQLSPSSEVNACNCRERTYYHTAKEIRAILNGEQDVPCPTHGIRDLGEFRWQWYEPWSLLPEDIKYCDCPPNSERHYAE